MMVMPGEVMAVVLFARLSLIGNAILISIRLIAYLFVMMGIYFRMSNARMQ